ncbi:hypothetical protein HPB52_015090 [Rhipicephalus sanguineus]|uniref:Uncharacterized protein n=1 Tax=Rhipicephalus sanguineus TaxID=34632 RepID=A0A9D4PPZ7_RHISA|nr:hypothetical protein HPB52_015090 [Rhipicephalus sanguineus]
MTHLPTAATSRPFIGPPIFKGTPEESVSVWMPCYEQVSSLISWDDDAKVKFLYLALEDAAKMAYNENFDWCSKYLGPVGHACFTGGHAAEIARLRLEKRVQLPAGGPEQCYYDVLHLCALAAMKQEHRVRHLLRGVRADALEKMILAKPTSSAEILRTAHKPRCLDGPCPFDGLG